MDSWRDYILREFAPGVAQLTLVADPDGLLTEEGVSAALRQRGFEIIPFEDPMAFRYAYESKHRACWDRGETTDLVVAFRSPGHDLHDLPHDLLQVGRQLHFGLGDLFPNLSLPVVEALDRGHLDALYLAQTQHAPGTLGDNATKDFVLRHVFQLAPETVSLPSDLLRLLLSKHYGDKRIPAVFDERLLFALGQAGRFGDWPLADIVPNREAFYEFLQERWPIFLDLLVAARDPRVGESQPSAALAYPGPVDLPFDHDDVRVYIDNLFLEGTLRPVDHPRADMLSAEWTAVGVRVGRDRDTSRHIGRLLDSAESCLPTRDSPHHAWLAFAQRWAVLTAGWYASPTQDRQQHRFLELREKMDHEFTAWTEVRYQALHNLPPSPPVMCHHIPRHVAHAQASGTRMGKVALVVLDGLALDQWIVVRNVLVQRHPDLRFQESTVFAWVPTLTSVCRQAIFAGRPPLYFPATIASTGNDSAAWHQFWTDQGLTAGEVTLTRAADEMAPSAVAEAVSVPKLRVVGIVVDKVDKIMHGMHMGTAGMHSQVRQWAEGAFMSELLALLLGHGFTVFLTSDHGNIEAIGCGSPSEGATADLRGLRARVYPEPVLRAEVKKRFPDAIEWPSTGLPEDYLPLIAPRRSAFTTEHSRVVAHGGACLEEVVAPFVRVDATSA